MKDRVRSWKEELRVHWRRCLFQSVFAAIVILGVLLSLNFQNNPAIISSMASTAFIIFATPKSVFARPKSIIGGHLTGLVCGIAAAMVLRNDFISSHLLLESVTYSLSIAVSIFIMITFSVEHPPAAGTALGVALQGWGWAVVFSVAVSSAVLAVIYLIAKRHLHNLT